MTPNNVTRRKHPNSEKGQEKIAGEHRSSTMVLLQTEIDFCLPGRYERNHGKMMTESHERRML